jgi:RimJ/RimL family protein N-acetyltransferase/SAM-dependent methyltransferase
MVFRWRNIPEIVAVGASNRTVPWEEHRQWFHTFLSGGGYSLSIILLDGQPVGQVRFDRKNDTTLDVSIYLLPGYTGRGLGISALTRACRQAFDDPSIHCIEAHIRQENQHSVSAFQKAGFEKSGTTSGADDLFRCVLTRSGLARAGSLGSQRTEWKGDDARSVEYFTSLVEKHGIDSRALDWGSRESQQLRFAMLARIGDLRGASVLDVGCGQGDLLAWLQEQRLDVRYRGVDITPAMIDVAKKRFADQDFTVCNVLENPPLPQSVDYVIASGVFYLRQTEPMAFMQAMVRTLFAACRKGVAFNSLSAWSPVREAGEFYADPAEVIAWCRQLTPRLAMLHDYHPRDFSMFLYR